MQLKVPYKKPDKDGNEYEDFHVINVVPKKSVYENIIPELERTYGNNITRKNNIAQTNLVPGVWLSEWDSPQVMQGGRNIYAGSNRDFMFGGKAGAYTMIDRNKNPMTLGQAIDSIASDATSRNNALLTYAYENGYLSPTEEITEKTLQTLEQLKNIKTVPNYYGVMNLFY